jgi:glycosyltransferase involved in cell wall biosynthesis
VQFALALGADIIVNTDADNQYPGSEISKLIAPILADQADMVIGDRQTLANEHFSKSKRWMEHFGSSVMRRVSQTNVPDAVSGFRAFSRYAALRLQVYNPYSYTLETLVQAGKGQMKLANVPIRTNPAVRESRLHKGIFNFIWRQGGAIIRSYVLYQPLRTFVGTGSLFFLAGSILLGRFLVGYLFLDMGSRYIQSVSIGGTLLTAGITLIMFGFLGDAMRANRQAAEETMISQRDQARLPKPADLREFQGHPVYSASNPPVFSVNE